jgi:hypothetical protein
MAATQKISIKEGADCGTCTSPKEFLHIRIVAL